MRHGPAHPGSQHPPPSHHYLPRADGARLALYTDGPDDAAVTVVLAHGWCATASIWHAHARHLAAHGIRVIRYDQRGHGASLTGTSPASTQLLADDLAAVLRTPAAAPTSWSPGTAWAAWPSCSWQPTTQLSQPACQESYW